jgi:hypothetical protein
MTSALGNVAAGKPLLMAVQLDPPSVLLKTPSVPPPAYTVVLLDGSMARTLAFLIELPRSVQTAPPFVLLKIPPLVPA